MSPHYAGGSELFIIQYKQITKLISQLFFFFYLYANWTSQEVIEILLKLNKQLQSQKKLVRIL
jgi:hypothetical protein